MVQNICKDTFFLRLRADAATAEDRQIGQDLLDTLRANREHCVGMDANMIGKAKKIIVFDEDGTLQLLYNPEIIKKTGEYRAEEGCLSLEGTRSVTRYRSIKVRYENEQGQIRLKTYRDFTAQIIQHECDHLAGILI